MPNAVCSLLLESGVRNLGIHTEMLTDGLIDLYKGGSSPVRTRRWIPARLSSASHWARKNSIAAVDRNPDFLCCPVEYTNLPHIIMQNDRVDGDQQYDSNGFAGSSLFRIVRPSPHQRHRRTAAIRPRRVRIEGRQVLHLSVLDL